MNKPKKIDVPVFELDLPDEFKPEWYKLGIEPTKMRSVLEEGDMMFKKPQVSNYRRGIPPIEEKPMTVKEAEKENLISIKEAEVMTDPSEYAWFNADDQPEDIENIVDNNEDVNVEGIQQINVPEETYDSIHNIRDKLLKRKQRNRMADVGDFVVLHKGANIYVGDESGVGEVCEQIILENENLTDDDLVVFYRVSLQKFFR